MPLFQKKLKNIIGVDIGTSSIKMIELSHREGRFYLSTYGFVEGLGREGTVSAKADESYLAKQIMRIKESTKFTSNVAVAALPSYAVFTSIISVPAMSKDELNSAIQWEAKKIIPLPLEDIVLDSEILNPPDPKVRPKKGEESSEPLKVLITGAPKDLVKRYTQIFQEAGLTLAGLETETFALARSLVADDPGEIMIVEIGAATTDLIIVQKGVPFLSRSIEQGGNAITRSIVNSLNISDKRSEQLKRDIGITTLDANTGGGGVPQIVERALEPIIHEIRYTLGLYKEGEVMTIDTSLGSIEKIILTGGSAMMPNVASYLAKALDMRVVVADPWSHVNYDEDLRPVLAGIGSRFSVAIGLAMRDV
ncbi:MAG: type IV pilus assembly protein PilM [bacterium]|nr:type IV pilus assembly protein PilM [bacterium]